MIVRCAISGGENGSFGPASNLSAAIVATAAPFRRQFLNLRAPVVLAICAGLTGALFIEWRTSLEKRCDVLSADLARAEREWKSLAKEIPDAERARMKLEATLSLP